MKIIIAGSRNFNDYEFLKGKMDEFTRQNPKNTLEIVSGTAKGADQLGERYATEHNIRLKRFPARWELHGRSAGFRRNAEMAEYADTSIVFCVNNSAGSLHMHNLMKTKNKRAIIHHVRYN